MTKVWVESQIVLKKTLKGPILKFFQGLGFHVIHNMWKTVTVDIQEQGLSLADVGSNSSAAT